MIQNQPQEDNIYLFHIQYYHRTGLMPAATDNPVYAPHRTESNLMTKCLSVECCKEKLVSYTSFIKSVYPRTQELCVWISARATAHDQKALTCLQCCQLQNQNLFQIFQLYAFQQASCLEQTEYKYTIRIQLQVVATYIKYMKNSPILT